MEVVHPAVRRCIQVASYQREGLFNRSPNIIPTSLKMLVEPNLSSRTDTLLATPLEEPLLELAQSETREDSGDVNAAIAEAIAISERVNARIARYLLAHASKKGSHSSGQVDTALENSNIDTARLKRVKEYYEDLLLINEESLALLAVQKKCACPSENFKLDITHEAAQEQTSQMKCLKEVVWE